MTAFAASFLLAASVVSEPTPRGTLDFAGGLGDYRIYNHVSRIVFSSDTFLGEPCLGIRAANPDEDADTAWRVLSSEFSVQAGDRFAVKVRAAGSIDMTVNYQNGWSAQVLWFDADHVPLRTTDPLGKAIDLVTYFGFRCRTSRWVETIFRDTVPDGAAFGILQLGADSPNVGGEGWIRLSRAGYYEAASDGDLAFPGDWEEPQVVRFEPSGPCADFSSPIVFRLADASALARVQVVLDGADVTDRLVRSEDNVFTCVPEAPWAEGSLHSVVISAADAFGNDMSEERFVYFTQSSVVHPKYAVRDDGMMLRDGQPFFPLTFFSVRPCPPNGRNMDTAVSELAENGFVGVHSYLRMDSDPVNYEALEAACDRYDMPLLTEPAARTEATDEQRQARDAAVRTAVLGGRSRFCRCGWVIGDDTASQRTPEQVKRDHLALHAMDDGIVTAQADGAKVEGRYLQYAPYTDVFMIEVYPMREAEPEPQEMAELKRHLEIARTDLRRSGVANRSLWAIPQTFDGWDSWKRYPTPAEIRCETMLSVACGMRGITYYTYCSGGLQWGARVDPVHWAEVCRIGREFRAYMPDLVARDAAEQPTMEVVAGATADAYGQFPVTALLKETGRLFAASSAAEPTTVRFTLPDGTSFVHRFPRNGTLVAGRGVRLSLVNCDCPVTEDETLTDPVELVGDVGFDIPAGVTLELAGEVRMSEDARITVRGGGTLRFAHDLVWRGDLDIVDGTVSFSGACRYENAEGDESVRRIDIRSNGCLRVEHIGVEMTSPRDVHVEDGGYVYLGGRTVFPVRHLYTNGVRTVRGLCYASADTTFCRGTKNQGLMPVLFTWTGAGDGRSWTDAANWEDDEVPGLAPQIVPTGAADSYRCIYADLSAATNVVQNSRNGGVITIGGIVYNPNGGPKRLVLEPGTRTSGNRNAIRFARAQCQICCFVGSGREIVFEDINLRQEGSGDWGFYGGGTFRIRGDANLFCDEWAWGFCTRNIMPLSHVVFERLTNTLETATRDMSFVVFKDDNRFTDVEVGAGSRFYIQDLVWGNKGYNPLPSFRQTDGSWFSPRRICLTMTSGAWGPSAYFLEGGELEVREALLLGSMVADDEEHPQYPGGDFRMSGGILRTPRIDCECNDNHLYLDGGDVYLGAGGLVRTTAVRSNAAWYRFKGNATPAVQWGGATLHATGDFTCELDVSLTAAARLDLSGHAVTLAAPVTGPGRLVVEGEGTLRLGAGADLSAVAVDVPSLKSVSVAEGTAVRQLFVGGVGRMSGTYRVDGGTLTVLEDYDPTLSEALGGGAFDWADGGEAPWRPARRKMSDGSRPVAVSGVVGDLGRSVLETSVSGAGRLSFVWSVSCEDGYDWLELEIDGQTVRALTGEIEGREVAVDLGEGEHVLRWVYWKDEATDPGCAGADRAELERVTWTPAGSPQTPDRGTLGLSNFYDWLKENRR